ncbi:MAG: RNA methyltransferase [Clostridia bacterium]|nr:RNA methyltransferase [Clostridia bacterium]
MYGEIITSRQNTLVRNVCALSEKKTRRESGLFRFDGIKLLGEAMSANIAIRQVFFNAETDGRAPEYIRSVRDELERGGAKVVAVSASVFDKISEEKSPEGIVTVAEIPRELCRTYAQRSDLPSPAERILVAESLRDPANLGTIMRSAYALGIDRLVLTDDCAEIYSPKTIRAAMGAAFRMSTLTVKGSEIAEFIGLLRESGRRVYATALYEDSKTLGDIELRACDCFVIGNEGHGLSDSAVRACDASVIIPMREDAESLNAAAAAAICIWETVRVEAL